MPARLSIVRIFIMALYLTHFMPLLFSRVLEMDIGMTWVKKHSYELFRYFEISVSKDNTHLLIIYWLPKNSKLGLLLQLHRVP